MLPIKLGRFARASWSLGAEPPTSRPCHLSAILSPMSESSKTKNKSLEIDIYIQHID